MRSCSKWSRISVLALALSVSAGLVLAGCGPKAGTPAPEKAKAFKKEPTISLFMKETGEKKDLPIEEYIAGVVAGEMLPKWPTQAYEAQAIMARTFTLELMERTGGTKKLHGTDMSTDENEAQAYSAKDISPEIREAVKNTRGEVLTYSGEYVRTWFFAESGGQTALAKEGLNIKEEEPPYTESVKVDERDAPPEAKEWAVSIPMTEVATAITAVTQGASVKSIKVAERGPSGRVTKFAVDTDTGTKEVHGNDMRVAIGPEKMRSTLLTSIASEGGNLKMSGKGFGHGVGMSQWGAYTLAKQGMKGDKIVMKFFKDVKVEKLWD